MKPHRDWLAPALLFAIGAVICRGLFFTAYLSHMGSVDGSYIAMARFDMRHWGDLAWWPIWFTGMSFQNVYGPVLHLATAGLAALSRQSPGWALHTLGALVYCLGPVTLWRAVLRLSGSRAWALSSALFFTLASPAAMLVPSIRADVGGFFHLRRLQTMVIYGEYPHIAVLTLAPIALLAFERMRSTRRPAWIAATAMLFAVIACTSVTGTVGFAMAMLAWLIALPAADSVRSLPRLALCAGLGYALALPWIPPSTIKLVYLNSQWGTGRHTPFTLRSLLYFALIALGTLGLRFALGRFGTPPLLRFAVLLMFFSGILLAADLGAGAAIVPQPYRFQLEFELACSVAAGYLWMRAAGRLRPRMQWAIACAPALALLVANTAHTGRYIRPIDIRDTVEYQSAMWFDRNMNGARVFAPGSISYWMNAFTDTPQLGGCCDQGVPSWEERVALYSVYTGQNMGAREGTVSLLWLQAYGVHAVEVGGPGSREFYKPYWNARKFDGLLPVLWRSGGDTIYRVPQRSASLAHVMPESGLITIAARPKDGLDTAGLERYVGALNDAQFALAEFRWLGPGRARIAANLASGQVISVQVSYDRGWRAHANGQDIPVSGDGLGLMVLHPRCSGSCTIDLEYDGGAEFRLARGVRALALLAVLIALGTALRPRHSDSCLLSPDS